MEDGPRLEASERIIKWASFHDLLAIVAFSQAGFDRKDQSRSLYFAVREATGLPKWFPSPIIRLKLTVSSYP